jgi:proteasome alpha subunit
LTDPSGTYIGYDAVAIGAGSDQVTEFLEKQYQIEISMDDAGALAMQSIYLVSEEKTGTRHVKMAVIDNEAKTMKKIEDQDIERYASIAKDKTPKA